jgi:hypothetical protein
MCSPQALGLHLFSFAFSPREAMTAVSFRYGRQHSVRDQERQRTMIQQSTGRAAKQALSKRGMVETSNNDQARLTPLRFPKEVIRHGSLFADEVMENGMNAVVVEVPFDISSDKGVLADGLRIGNDDDGNRPCLVEIRQGF